MNLDKENELTTELKVKRDIKRVWWASVLNRSFEEDSLILSIQLKFDITV